MGAELPYPAMQLWFHINISHGKCTTQKQKTKLLLIKVGPERKSLFWYQTR